MTWQDHRACVGVSSDAFFPANGKWRPSAPICVRCPVRQECLDAVNAMTLGAATDGMFGGLTPEEREALVGPVGGLESGGFTPALGIARRRR